MKKFEFTLNRILDYRQSLLEKEKNSLMQLFSHRNTLEDRLLELENLFAEVSEELRATAEGGTTIAELQRINVKLQATQRSIERCHLQLEELEADIDHQREVVKEVSRQVTGLEKLQDKQREEYDYSSRKEEEERIAEIISTKIARQAV